MTAHLYTFEKLVAASSHETIFEFLNAQCDKLGYTSYFYSPLISERTTKSSTSPKLFKDDSKIVEGEGLVKQKAFTTYPSSWIHRYQEAKHVEVDPVVRKISKSNLPVVWNEVIASNPRHVVFDEARQHNLASGITVPICGQNGERALFSVATDIPLERSENHNAVNTGMVLLTALYLHEAVQRVAQNQNEKPVPMLTSREKDCLQWAAHGKSSWEIANILSVSERTVVFHITNATKKLGSINRRQAVVRAINLGIISP